jgi:plastocyanin
MTMRARRLSVLTAVAFLLASAAPAALAEPQRVVAGIDNQFSPREVAIRPGESVTFTNQGGDHNMVWNDGAPAQPPTSVPPQQWPAEGLSRTFTRPGRYRYYCDAHGDRNDDFGMTGYVNVNAKGVLPPTLSGLTATAARAGVMVGFRASRAGRLKATLMRRSGRRFVRHRTATLVARAGANSQRIAATLAPGAYRLEAVLTDADGVSSQLRTKTFSVR